MTTTSWSGAAILLALMAGLTGCKSNSPSASTLPSGSVSITASGVVTPGTMAPADKTTEFLSAFKPKEQQ